MSAKKSKFRLALFFIFLVPTVKKIPLKNLLNRGIFFQPKSDRFRAAIVNHEAVSPVNGPAAVSCDKKAEKPAGSQEVEVRPKTSALPLPNDSAKEVHYGNQ